MRVDSYISRRLQNRIIFLITKLAVRFLYLRLVQVSVEGLHHIPVHGGAVLVANHRSMIDGPLLYSLLDRMVYSFIKEDYFWNPVVRWYLRAGGGIPVQTGALRLSTVKQAHIALNDGERLLVFPEGRINTEEGVSGFNPAFMKLAMTHRVPVIPVSIIGTDQIIPNAEWRWTPKPGHVRIVVHEGSQWLPFTKNKELIECAVTMVHRTISQTWSHCQSAYRFNVPLVAQSMVTQDRVIMDDRVQGGW